jgi:hypothetical protein
LFCQIPRSLAAAATAAQGSRAAGLFCQTPGSLAAAATAAHGLRRGRDAAGRCTESKSLIADFRRDSARRS